MTSQPQIPVLYEDNHLLVVVKPANIPSQEDKSRDPDLLSLLKEDLKQRYNKPGNVYLGLVHRLDRPVGGVMVFAKTSKAASRLSDQVRTRQLAKTYLAVVHGKPLPAAGTLRHYLLKDAAANMVRVARASEPGAKEAVLEYETIGSEGSLSLVRIRLHTGRPHQIRVQMAAAGCPLYGDGKYGPNVSRSRQIALWAAALGLTHPTTKEAMRFHRLPPMTHPWNLWPLSVYGSESP